MNYKTSAKSLVRIAEACEITDFMPGNSEEPLHAFGVGPESLVVRGADNLKIFNSAIKALYKSTTDLAHTITIKEFETRVVAVVSLCKKSKHLPTEQTARDLIDGVLKEPRKKWTVVRPLYGASIGALPELVLGPFTLFPTKSLQTRIKATHTRRTPISGDFFEKLPPTCVSCTVECSKGDRAQELSVADFERFELIIAYMIGVRDSTCSVSVLNVRHRHVAQSIAFATDDMTMGSQLVGPLHNVDLADPYFRSTDAGHERLWELLSEASHNEMEKRLVNAIEWTGRALLDADEAKAMIQFMLAVESLLQLDQRDIIKPSIISQIAEAAAFILGRDCESRIHIERRVKELYSRRSAHVHAGSRHVERQDLFEALDLAKGLTHAFLVSPDYAALQKASDVASHVKKLRYG